MVRKCDVDVPLSQSQMAKVQDGIPKPKVTTVGGLSHPTIGPP